MKIVIFCSHSLENLKIGRFTSKSYDDDKEMYKNACCFLQSCCFADLNLFFSFLPFPSTSWVLKLPFL